MIVFQWRQARPVQTIEMIKCELTNGVRTRIVWIASYEVFVDFDVEIREEGRSEYWKITRVLTPDQT
jgi:hypothetical protein